RPHLPPGHHRGRVRRGCGSGRPALPDRARRRRHRRPRRARRHPPAAGGLMPATIVTDATFEAEVLRSDVPVVVDFWAAWCGPCRQVAPVLEQLSEDYTGRAKIVKVDADANPQTVAAAGVVSIPTLSFYVDGALVRS